MHSEKQRAIIEKINDIITHPADPSPPNTVPQRILLVGGGRGFCMAGNQLEEYEDICNQLLKEKGWSEKFSRGHIEQSVNKVLSRLFQEGGINNTQVYFEELLTEHDTFTQENT